MIFRRIATSLLLSILLSGGQSFAQQLTAKSSATSEIRQVLETQVAAWNRGDIPAFMDGYWKSDDTTFAGASGVQRGWSAVLARYQKTYPDRAAMGTLAFSDLEINLICGDAAFVMGKWQLQRASDQLGGVFTLIFRKFPDGWKIVHDHTSQFPVSPSPAPAKPVSKP